MKLTYESLMEKLSEFREDNRKCWSGPCDGHPKLDLKGASIEGLDLSGMDFSRVDFSWAEFSNVNFRGCIFDESNLSNIRARQTDFSNSLFKDAILCGGDFRTCDLSNSDCDGTDFTEAILLDTKLEGVRDTEKTKHFRVHCPENGYFFGYKKCFNDRLVTLLIEKDSKRCSSTSGACRCDKARVVAITSLDERVSYDEAVSFVDGEFIYKLGEVVEADSYNENRWLDSSHGIHFWMTKEEALGYM